MAKLGEGDKRWIVEQRPDGANVNQWHWTERDETKFAKEWLKHLLCEQPLDETGLITFAKDIDRWDGDVLMFNRKGKQSVVYNLEVTMKWSGKIKDAEGKTLVRAKGAVSIYELSEEALEDGLDLTITVDSSKALGDADKLRAIVKTEAARLLAQQGKAFDTVLKARLAEMNGGPPVEQIPKKVSTAPAAPQSTVTVHKGAAQGCTAGEPEPAAGAVKVAGPTAEEVSRRFTLNTGTPPCKIHTVYLCGVAYREGCVGGRLW